jgi:hypothetical protein
LSADNRLSSKAQALNRSEPNAAEADCGESVENSASPDKNRGGASAIHLGAVKKRPERLKHRRSVEKIPEAAKTSSKAGKHRRGGEKERRNGRRPGPERLLAIRAEMATQASQLPKFDKLTHWPRAPQTAPPGTLSKCPDLVRGKIRTGYKEPNRCGG